MTDTDSIAGRTIAADLARGDIVLLDSGDTKTVEEVLPAGSMFRSGGGTMMVYFDDGTWSPTWKDAEVYLARP